MDRIDRIDRVRRIEHTINVRSFLSVACVTLSAAVPLKRLRQAVRRSLDGRCVDCNTPMEERHDEEIGRPALICPRCEP